MTKPTSHSNPAQRHNADEYGISIRIASFNLRNCALPNTVFYDNHEPYSTAFYERKRAWIAQHLDEMNADIVVFQEVFDVAALKDALAQTRTLQHAKLIARDAVSAPTSNQRVPQVAIATRLPILGEAVWFSTYPNPYTPDGFEQPLTQMTRAVPHITVKLPNDVPLHILGVHLKSKRPDFISHENESDDTDLARATLRSLIRRGADALALRSYLSQILNSKINRQREPCIVAGDFNDAAHSVTTQMIAGAGRFGKSGFDTQLFDAQRIQVKNDPLRNVVYSHIHEGSLEILDHLLVSEEFHPHSRHAIAQVREVYCLNDHLHHRQPHTSDHGIMVAQLLFKNTVG